MSEWFKCSDGFPKSYVEVMVYPRPSEQTITAEYDANRGWGYYEYVHNHGWDRVKCNVTHWMPLPDAPKC